MPVGGAFPDRLDEYIQTGVTITQGTLSIKELRTLGVSMYLNPAHGFSTIKSETALGNISLYSLTGKLIMSSRAESNDYQLDLSTD